MNEQIVTYLRENRGRYTDDALKQQLLDAGYEQAEIDEAFALVARDDRDQGRSGRRREAMLLVVVMYVLTFLVLVVPTDMGPRTYGLGPIILGLTLLLVGVPAMIYVGRHRGLAEGVQGALLGALVFPFVLLVIVAGLCVATVNPFPPSARAPTEPGPPPEEVATELGDGRLARASGVYGDSGPAYAFDGDRETIWNSGSFGPQWIEIDLPAGRAIMGIRLVVAQSPGGERTTRSPASRTREANTPSSTSSASPLMARSSATSPTCLSRDSGLFGLPPIRARPGLPGARSRSTRSVSRRVSRMKDGKTEAVPRPGLSGGA